MEEEAECCNMEDAVEDVEEDAVEDAEAVGDVEAVEGVEAAAPLLNNQCLCFNTS